jgi:hypothetical protein
MFAPLNDDEVRSQGNLDIGILEGSLHSFSRDVEGGCESFDQSLALLWIDSALVQLIELVELSVSLSKCLVEKRALDWNVIVGKDPAESFLSNRICDDGIT